MSQGSITHWIQEIQAGDEGLAQERLWQHYFRRLAGLARKKLVGIRGMADEEDVVLSAFNSFFQGVRNGEYPELRDRSNLWPLLATITARKAVNQRNRELAQKRGAGNIRGESVFMYPGDTEPPSGIEQVLGSEPTPEFAVEMAELCQQLLIRLPEDLRLIADRRLQGYSCREIAEEIGRAKRTVERKVEMIRTFWSDCI